MASISTAWRSHCTKTLRGRVAFRHQPRRTRAFHKARELLQSIGIGLPKGPECHTKLYHVLSQANDPEVQRASAKLNSLREARNDADYDLTDSRPENKKAVAIHLAAAKEVIACMDACFAGQPKAGIHADLRAYARDVLKLSVSF